MPSSTISAYIELTKPRIMTLVLVTAAIGFLLGGHGVIHIPALATLIVGVALVCGGASALNHYLERDVDSRMLRTRNRPLPSGLITPAHALSFGIILILSGVFILWWGTNLLTSFLSLLSAFLYVLVYTPMKRISWLNTSVGAIPGALPPMGGWAAASGELGLGAWVLFLILFLWQHPHFYAIAWMLKEDYARGGFKMLPVVKPNSGETFTHINLFAAALIPVSLVPTFLGLSGRVYLVGAFIAGALFLLQGIRFAQDHSHKCAHTMLRASVIYLPIILFLIVIDSSF